MFCDRCDRGYHTFCVGLKAIPTGRWKCTSCKEIKAVLQPSVPRALLIATPIKAKYADPFAQLSLTFWYLNKLLISSIFVNDARVAFDRLSELNNSASLQILNLFSLDNFLMISINYSHVF